MKRHIALLAASLIALLLTGSLALAIGPGWMPGFPMRMGPSVMLMWAPVPGATGYNIYKSDKDGDLGPKFASVPMNNHMDMNVPLDKSAFYTIKAVMAGGAESDPSVAGRIIGVKPLDPPRWEGSLQVEGGISVRWAMVKDAVFYNAYKATVKDGPYNLLGSFQDTKLTDTDVKEGNTYFYKVSAVDKNNAESKLSEIHEFAMVKQQVVKAAKTWKQVDRVVKFVDFLFGPDDAPFKAPRIIEAVGAEAFVVVDNTEVVAMNLQGERLGKVEAPPNYKDVWGSPTSVSITKDGRILTTWTDYRGARVFDIDGNLVKEWRLKKPTLEEYKALGREKDWNEDAGFEITPTGMAEDAKGNFWVVEGVFSQIHVFDADGNLLRKIGEPRKRGDTPDITGILGTIQYDAATNRMYLLDMSYRTVRAYDPNTFDFIKGEDGQPNYGWNRGGGGVGQVQKMVAFQVHDGEIYLIDRMSGGINVYDMNLEYKASIVLKPEQKIVDELNGSTDLAIVGTKLYVAQNLAGRVAIFDLK